MQIKRGDTLRFNVELKDADNDPLVLAIENIQSQVRSKNGKLIGTFTVAETLTPGTYLLSNTNTSGFPVGSLECDIQLNINGTIISSATFVIEVVKDITI